MKVSVRWSRRSLDLQLDLAAPTAVFKRALFELTGVEPERQKLMVKRVGMVKDAQNWDAYKIQDGAALVLMGTPSGKAVKVGLPEAWSVLAHGWRSHGLPAGSLTRLQAALLRLSWAGLLQERLGTDAGFTFVADDCDVFARIGRLVVSNAQRFERRGDGQGVLQHIAMCQARESRCRFSLDALLSPLGFQSPDLQLPGLGVLGQPNSTLLSVDLGEGRLLAPDHYALQLPPAELQLGRWDLRALNLQPGTIAWELQGAMQTEGPWTTLSTHVYEELDMHSPPRGEPNKPESSTVWERRMGRKLALMEARPGHWAIKGESPGWRCFRVIQLRNNTVLAAGSRSRCSGLELWGVLKNSTCIGGASEEFSDEDPEPEPEPEPVLSSVPEPVLSSAPEPEPEPEPEVEELTEQPEPDQHEGAGSSLANPWLASRNAQQQDRDERQARIDAQAEAEARRHFVPDTWDPDAFDR
jgi:hypothetical protein